MRLYRSPLQNQKGFTLIEVMITVGVTVLALLGFIGANTSLQRSGENAHSRTIAIQDASRIAETMRNTAQTGTFPANVIAAFPPAIAVTGYNNLSNEQVLVSYVSSSANPLDATVTVSWTDNDNRTASTTLRTLITQRG